MLRGGAKACRSVTLGDSLVCAAHNCQCRQYSSTFASFPGSQQSTSARRRVLDRVVIPRTTAVPNHLAATVAKQQSSVTATTMTKRTSSSSPPHSSLSLPSSSVRRSGLVKNVLSASPRDLDILVRRCAAAAAAPSSSLLSSSAARPQWEEAVLLLQGALHLSMVPTRLTYRSVLELVAIHCTSLPSIRRILDGMSASHRSAALLSRYLLRYLARHQPRSALEFLLEDQGSAKEHTDYSSATMRLRQVSHPSSVGASFDVAAVSEALHRLSQSTAPAAPSAKSDTAELMLSILPYLEARRCPPQTEMIEALLWACSHISTSTSSNTDHAKGVWQVAMGLLQSVVVLGSPNKSVVADTTAPPPLAITSSMSVDFLRTLGGPQGGGQWASAVEFVIRHCKRDVLRDAHVQMAIAVALISSTGPSSSPHHSGTVVSGGIHNNNWQRALSIADRVVAQTPLYSGEDRWSVVRHVIPMIPSWRAALEYLRRSAVGSVYDDKSGAAAASDHNDASDTAVLPSTSNSATSTPLSHRDWIEAKAALVPRLPVSSIESRRFVLGWMKSDPRIAAARLLADAAAAERLGDAREEKAEALRRSGLLPLSPASIVLSSTPLLWSDALEAASTSLRSTSITTATEDVHQRLLVAAVFYELRRNEFPFPLMGDSCAIACVTINGQVQHAILHMDRAALKDLLRLVMPPPGSLKRGLPPGRAHFWEGALRLFTSAMSTTPSIVSGMQVLMQWQAEEVGDWASALSICAHIPVASVRRCSALEQLMSTKQLWMQALAYSSLCDASQEEGGGGGGKFVVTRTYGAPLCGSVGKYHAVRDVLRFIGVESDADRFLLDKAELGHEEALIRSDFEAALRNSTPSSSSQFGEAGAHHQHHQHNERPFLIHARRNPVIPLSLALLATSGWTLVLKHALVCSRRSSTCHRRHPEHSFLLEELNVLLSFAAVRFPAVPKHMWPYSLKALHAWWWGAHNGPVVVPEDESISNVATWRQSFVRELPHLCSDKGDVDVWFLAAAIGGTWTRLSCAPRYEGEGDAAALAQHLLSVDIAATLVDSLTATFSAPSTHQQVPPAAAPTTTQTEVAAEDMPNPLVIFTVRNAVALLLDVTLAPLLVGASTASSLSSSVDVVLHWGLQQHARPQVSRPSTSGADTDADPRPLLSVGSYVDRSLVARSQLRDDDDTMTTTTGHEGNQRGACTPPLSQGATIGVAAVEYLVGVCGCIPHADSLEGIAISLESGECRGTNSVNLLSQDDLRARAEWTSLWKRLMRCLTNPQAIAASAPYAALTRGALRCASLGEWANALRLFRQSFSIAPEATQVSDSLIYVRELQRRMNEETAAGLLRRCEDATTTQQNDANGLVAACLSLGPRRWSAALQLMSTFVGSPASPSPPHKDVDHGQPPTTSAISTPISTALMRHIVTSCASSTRDANVVLKVMHLLHHTYLFVPQREDLTSVLQAAFAASLSVGTGEIGADAALLHAALLLVTCLQRYFAAAAPTARELHVLLELCPWASSSGLRDALAVLSELRDVLQGAQLVDAMEAMLDLQEDHQRHAFGDTANNTGHTADATVASSPPAAQWMARGLAAFHETRRTGAKTSESAMDKRNGRWTTQRLRMVAQFVPELLSAEASDHAAATSNHVQRVAHTISDIVLHGTVPAYAVVEAWQTPAMRERLLRTHFSKQDGEDAKNSLSVVAGTSPAIAGGTATINTTTTTLHPSDSVISFAATYGPWIRFGSTTLVNKRAVLELGRDVAEAWPVHRLRTVLNVHRKHIARLQHRTLRSEGKGNDHQSQPHNDAKNNKPSFDPWASKEFVEDFLTSVPLLVRLLPFIYHGAVGGEGDMVRRETMEAVCSSVLHHLVPLRTLEKYWQELMTHAELLEERRWPSDAEGELVLAMTVTSPSASNPADRKSAGVCPTSLSALPSATPEEIRHYWAMYHPVLNPGASFHTKELRYIATHYYPLLQSAAASSSSPTMLADVCREIASEVFPLTAMNADGSSTARVDPTFQYHTAEDVQQLWRTSKTTLQDLWRTSPSSTMARVVDEERPHRREVTGAAEARHLPSSRMREFSGTVERQPPAQSTSMRSSRTPMHVTVATTPSFQKDPVCPPVAVESDVSSNSVVAVRWPSANLQRHRRRAVASVGSGLRWRVALSLLKWSLSSLPPPTDSNHHGSRNMSHELAHHLVPVVQLCMLDCNTSMEEARKRIEASLGPVGDECWATVCRHVVNGNNLTAVESESSAAVRDALAQHRESFPSVVLAALEHVLLNTTTSSGVEGEALLQVITNVTLNKSQKKTLKVLVEKWWPVNDSGEARQGVLTLLEQPR
ncbi:Hypothetical protein, putative [Bodo saltans]|uniref:Uncharacterized protein n=1 Tax=Bodo saltans TaxID=75058 RepID=A0A0S4ITR7_BODSA|nr:Hypothetical protein, putative [Bodo saltans]|eukprot:CUF89572.1 Hypothetical protein, putative [Bodo saltans]